MFRPALIALMVSCLALPASAMAPPAAEATGEAALSAALAAPTRSPANVSRDKYRPGETLSFRRKPGHGVGMHGGGGNRDSCPYFLPAGALSSPAGNMRADSRESGGQSAYRKVQVATFTAGEPTSLVAASADVVLTFRNVHSWLDGDAPIADNVFAEAFRVLKPGGTLGVVEHRLPESADDARQLESGYVKVSTVRRLAEAAGFKLVASSEINANPRHDRHPKGVWTLRHLCMATSTAPNMRDRRKPTMS